MWRASVTGSMSAAIDDACRLYHKRKADALRAGKLPELMPGAAVTFAELVKAARNYTERYHPASLHHFDCRMPKLLAHFGADTKAATIRPVHVEAFLGSLRRAPTTRNRYRSL